MSCIGVLYLCERQIWCTHYEEWSICATSLQVSHSVDRCHSLEGSDNHPRKMRTKNLLLMQWQFIWDLPDIQQLCAEEHTATRRNRAGNAFIAGGEPFLFISALRNKGWARISGQLKAFALRTGLYKNAETSALLNHVLWYLCMQPLNTCGSKLFPLN